MTIPDELASIRGLLTVQQLAGKLGYEKGVRGVSPKTIRKWMRKYGLPYTKVGSSVFLDPASVAEWWRERS